MTTPMQLGCAATGCTNTPTVQWRRRPTAAEFDAILNAEHMRRSQILADADPQLPSPEFGPLPTIEDSTVAVHSCSADAIGLELAAHVHAAGCTAPNTKLPGCDCTPEPIPNRQPQQAEAPELPPTWGGRIS